MFPLHRVTNCKSMTLVPSQWTKCTVIIYCNISNNHSYNELLWLLTIYKTKVYEICCWRQATNCGKNSIYWQNHRHITQTWMIFNTGIICYRYYGTFVKSTQTWKKWSFFCFKKLPEWNSTFLFDLHNLLPSTTCQYFFFFSSAGSSFFSSQFCVLNRRAGANASDSVPWTPL